jgi:hypothetical protein
MTFDDGIWLRQLCSLEFSVVILVLANMYRIYSILRTCTHTVFSALFFPLPELT